MFSMWHMLKRKGKVEEAIKDWAMGVVWCEGFDAMRIAGSGTKRLVGRSLQCYKLLGPFEWDGKCARWINLKAARKNLVGQLRSKVVCDRDRGVWSEVVSVSRNFCLDQC